MLLVLALAAGLWAVGWAAGLPHRLRWAMIGLLYLAVLGLHLILPDGHPLRLATGEEPALWLMLGGAALIALVYGRGVRALKRRATRADPAPEPESPPARFRRASSAAMPATSCCASWAGRGRSA